MNDVSVLYLSHLISKCRNISPVTNAVELPATEHEYILTSSQALKFHILLFFKVFDMALRYCIRYTDGTV